MNCKRKLILFLLFPFFLLSPWFYGFSVRAEAQYTIYETELATLENNSKQLLQNSEKKERLLTAQKEQLETANELIEKLRKSNEQTENSLEKIKKSYEEYEQEAEKKIKIKARQRNLWIAVSIGLGILAMK